MAITYTHTANIESPTGYTTELFVDNIRLEIPSILNDNSTVNLNKSESANSVSRKHWYNQISIRVHWHSY